MRLYPPSIHQAPLQSLLFWLSARWFLKLLRNLTFLSSFPLCIALFLFSINLDLMSRLFFRPQSDLLLSLRRTDQQAHILEYYVPNTKFLRMMTIKRPLLTQWWSRNAFFRLVPAVKTLYRIYPPCVTLGPNSQA